LADANRPLLRRLAREAPGTYAHSINVANLSEAAAAAIGANALLTRVGVYYHDVGKMVRPHYFIENQPGGRNPHDKLKPAMSAAVVRNHVLEGAKLAEEERLPDAIKAFILEHHGTQSISFFYDQAREADPDGDLDPRDFEYPGPKPQSRETAILMLADSVESASRVLPDPAPDNIRELVDRIVQGKIEAGQLDETPLTMKELTVIKAELTTILAGMYHQRIDYPSSRGRTDPATRDPEAPEPREEPAAEPEAATRR
jgi:cyclic-di-AMP phosphodiesterase PgpH